MKYTLTAILLAFVFTANATSNDEKIQKFKEGKIRKSNQKSAAIIQLTPIVVATPRVLTETPK
jgi:hypothetical protein